MTILPNQPFSYGLTLAAEYAKRSEHSMYKMGAVIMRRHLITAYGWNKNKTHPRAKNYTRKIHAELAALIASRLSETREIRSDLKNSDMYVARLTNGGFLATSKPCDDCMVLIQEVGIKSVTYIDEGGRVCRMTI